MVRNVSADSFTDEATGLSYFSAEIEITPAELESVRGSLDEANCGLCAAKPLRSVRQRPSCQTPKAVSVNLDQVLSHVPARRKQFLEQLLGDPPA